jgi:hypothetical protein
LKQYNTPHLLACLINSLETTTIVYDFDKRFQVCCMVYLSMRETKKRSWSSATSFCRRQTLVFSNTTGQLKGFGELFSRAE